MLDESPKKRSDLSINGKDLLALGYPQGKVIGKVLAMVEEEIIDDRLENNKEAIFAFLAKGINLDS